MKKISFDIITLFPNFFKSPFETSLQRKAIQKGILDIRIHDLREFGVGKHKQTDDRPFGGGPGMVLKTDVLAQALNKVLSGTRHSKRPYVILLDAAGNKLGQKKVEGLVKKESIVLICGHYEGVDERFKKLYVDEEISIGDYILSGGEAASLVTIDAISRLVPGFLGSSDSATTESFSKTFVEGKPLRLLDYPVYTKPTEFKGEKVPAILLSGNHKEISKWREQKSIEKTTKRRPDLLN